MRFEEKKQVTGELAEQLEASGIIYLTDFTGLGVKAITDFRSRLREQGIRYRVVKNTLMLRALEGLDLPDLSEHLEGPTGLIMSDEDPVAPAKIVKEFARDHDDRPVLKIGIVDRVAITPEVIGQMADLPPRDQLLAGIAGGLTSAAAGIAGSINALLRDITYMIGQVAEKNSTEA
jgi:large subunit ribosomal protein L10